MKKTIVFLSLVSLIGFGLNAADLVARGPLGFEAYDKNKDGAITQDEFDAVHKQRLQAKENAGMPMRNVNNAPQFSAFDVNGDGKLTKEELAQGQLNRRRSK